MNWTGRITILALAAVFAAGCCSLCDDLATCEGKLEQCNGKVEQCNGELEECRGQCEPLTAPVFTFEVEDSYGTFQPYNNQYDNEPPRPYRVGYLIQIGDFKGATHSWNRIHLYRAGSTTPFQTYARGDGLKAWIDVVCGATSPDPITPAMARRLAPEWGNPQTYRRRLHDDMQVYPPGNNNPRIVPATIWSGSGGLLVKQTTKTENQHGHTTYELTSAEACEVRVWNALGDAAPADTFSDVARIRVWEDGRDTQHGGPHQPIWK